MKLTITINNPSMPIIIIEDENEIKKFISQFKSNVTYVTGYNSASSEGGTNLAMNKYDDMIEIHDNNSVLYINRSTIQVVRIDN